MKAKENAYELWHKVYNSNQDIETWQATELVKIIVDEKYEGIINVLIDLKGRGELSEKIYLKSIVDMNKEWQEVKTEINNLYLT